MELRPIGFVSNQARHPVDTGWGQVVSEIRLRPELAAGLEGIDAFSHALVVFLMHEAVFDPGTHLVRRPQDREDMPLLGIFAQRARHRPNPVGVTTVEIVRVVGASLFVRGLDAMDGTPVLDVKPHVRAFDAPAPADEPAWIARLMADYF